MTCGLILLHFLKATMTLNDTTKHDIKHDTTTASTEQQHHVQAAEHLELAAKSHKEAAKSITAGDHKAALQHVETAKNHTSHASDHVKEAQKKSLPAAKAHA
jgi:F0F1-type ATP synthase membrane subunit b/b'